MNKHATIIISRSRGGDQDSIVIENGLAEFCSQQSGLDVLIIPHLYDLSDDSDVWDAIRAIKGHMLVAAWIYPRPAVIILSEHCISIELDCIFDLKEHPTASEWHMMISVRLGSDSHVLSGGGSIRELHSNARERWYPVIDPSLCANCGNCLQFCIFNVYTYDESHKVTATNPDNCKTGCPACSRICPEGAIIFPLYNKDAAISGAPGLRMSPDAAARRMFYMRTKKQCPVCHQTADDARIKSQSGASRICGECGTPVDSIGDTETCPDQDALNDIDLLIDDLDKITRRR